MHHRGMRKNNVEIQHPVIPTLSPYRLAKLREISKTMEGLEKGGAVTKHTLSQVLCLRKRREVSQQAQEFAFYRHEYQEVSQPTPSPIPWISSRETGGWDGTDGICTPI